MAEGERVGSAARGVDEHGCRTIVDVQGGRLGGAGLEGSRGRIGTGVHPLNGDDGADVYIDVKVG